MIRTVPPPVESITATPSGKIYARLPSAKRDLSTVSWPARHILDRLSEAFASTGHVHEMAKRSLAPPHFSAAQDHGPNLRISDNLPLSPQPLQSPSQRTPLGTWAAVAECQKRPFAAAIGMGTPARERGSSHSYAGCGSSEMGSVFH